MTASEIANALRMYGDVLVPVDERDAIPNVRGQRGSVARQKVYTAAEYVGHHVRTKLVDARWLIEVGAIRYEHEAPGLWILASLEGDA